MHTTPTEKLILLTKTKQHDPEKVLDISDNSHDFKWLSPLQKAVKNSKDHDLLILARDDPTSGILGLVNCMRRESGSERTRCVFLQHQTPNFCSDNTFYRKQLKKGFAMNVYKNKTWGTYRHLLLGSTQISSHCTVHITRRGDLSSFSWIENNEFSSPGSELVHVCFRSPLLI